MSGLGQFYLSPYWALLCRPEQRFCWAADVRTWEFAEKRDECGPRDAFRASELITDQGIIETK